MHHGVIRSSDGGRWPRRAVDCCLPSIGHYYWEKYWADTNTTQYWQVLADTQYRYCSNPNVL